MNHETRSSVSPRRRITSVVAAASALLLGLTACGSAQSAEPTVSVEDLKPGVEPQPLADRVELKAAIAGNGEGYAALTIAEAMGEFEKENIGMQIDVVSPASSIFALMARGQLDLAVTAPFGGMFNQAAEGSNIRFVTGGGEVSAAAEAGWWQVPSGAGEPTACDLKGKNVAIPTGGESNPLAISLNAYLESCDLSLSDVTLVELTPPETVQALQNGAVDLGSVSNPFAKTLKDTGDAVWVAPWNTGIIGTVMGDLREERPDVAQAVVRAMTRTAQTHLAGDYHQNPEVMAALSSIIGVDEDSIRAGAPRVFDPALPPPFESVPPLEEFWLEVGGLLDYDQALGVEKITDISIVDSVIE